MAAPKSPLGCAGSTGLGGRQPALECLQVRIRQDSQFVLIQTQDFHPREENFRVLARLRGLRVLPQSQEEQKGDGRGER
jgi:hypothetical protein